MRIVDPNCARVMVGSKVDVLLLVVDLLVELVEVSDKSRLLEWH